MEAVSLENSIADVLRKIKDKTLDMGEELEEDVKTDILEKIEEKHNLMMRKQGKHQRLSEIMARSGNLPLVGDKLLQSAKMQKAEIQSQRYKLNTMRERTSELARTLSPMGGRVPRVRTSSRLEDRGDRNQRVMSSGRGKARRTPSQGAISARKTVML